MNLNSLFYLLIHYFEMEKHIKSLALLHCFDKNLSIELLKMLSYHNFSIFLLPVNESNTIQTTTAIQKLSYGMHSFGVLWIYDCNSSEEVVASVSEACFTSLNLTYSITSFFLFYFFYSAIIVFKQNLSG